MASSLDLELVIYQIGKLGSLVCLSCRSTGTCNHVVPVWFDYDGENLYDIRSDYMPPPQNTQPEELHII